MRRTMWIVAVGASLVLAACGGGEEEAGGDGGPACSPSGTALAVSAQNTAFSTDCLAAPAGQAFTIEFDNQDAETHNVAIYTDDSASEPLFQGEIFGGVDSRTYDVDALAAGTYFFRCDVHPGQMNGDFIVE